MREHPDLARARDGRRDPAVRALHGDRQLGEARHAAAGHVDDVGALGEVPDLVDAESRRVVAEHVRAGVADEVVVARPAGERVVAALAVEEVAGRAAGEAVAAGVADDRPRAAGREPAPVMVSFEVEPQAFSKCVAVRLRLTAAAESVATAQSAPAPPSIESPARKYAKSLPAPPSMVSALAPPVAPCPTRVSAAVAVAPFIMSPRNEPTRSRGPTWRG